VLATSDITSLIRCLIYYSLLLTRGATRVLLRGEGRVGWGVELENEKFFVTSF